MRTHIQVLSEDERAQVHERSLEVLAKVGIWVETAQGRQILKGAGAQVNEATNVVTFPRELVEESLRLATKDFALGARRPGWDLQMNAGDCTLCPSGEAVWMLDRQTGERRKALFDDFVMATRLIDALDEVGVWWYIVKPSDLGDTVGDFVRYTSQVFANFSKHVNDGTTVPEQAPWLLEVLQVIFGDKETIRRTHPYSFLVCPLSPLAIEGPYTDALLALSGWNFPVAAMPMPLMGATAPASLISTVVTGNCEVLSMLCLVQAAEPGTPFIYAPVLAAMDPRSGRLFSSSIESSLMSCAAIEMARYYGLPTMGSGGGSGQYVPGTQAGYELALGGLPPTLSWPDIMVGPGTLGGAMVLSLEQLLLDVEMFKIGRQAKRGISTDEDKWLDEVIARVGPAGNYLGERSTRQAVRDGTWHLPELGWFDTYDKWLAEGKPQLLDQVRERVDEILATHEPLPLDGDVVRELERIEARAREAF
jgi:trimethylamine--corrinoid protein Co-methyltransferase